MDVQPGQQMRVIGAGLFPALVRQRQQEGQGRSAQGLGRGPRPRAGHVGHAVMHHPVHLVDRVLMRGGPAGLETAALVDRHVDQHRARLHLLQLRPTDQLGGRGTRNQHRADHHVGGPHQLGQSARAGILRHQLAVEDVVQIGKARDRTVKHRHPRPHPDRDPRRGRADHAAADDHHIRRSHPRHPAQKDPAPAIGLLQRPGPDLRRQPPRHLGHRRQQGQPPPCIGHRLIGDAGRAAGQKVPGLLRVRRQVQIGEQHLSRPQPLALGGLRLLDLHDHLGPGEQLLGRGHDLRPRRRVIRVGKARTQTRAALDHHLMTMRQRLACRVRCHSDPEFLRLDFPWTSDLHLILPGGILPPCDNQSDPVLRAML